MRVCVCMFVITYGYLNYVRSYRRMLVFMEMHTYKFLFCVRVIASLRITFYGSLHVIVIHIFVCMLKARRSELSQTWAARFCCGITFHVDRNNLPTPVSSARRFPISPLFAAALA